MFITPAYAQAAGGGGELMSILFPLIAMVAIFYFLVMRPQQKRLKDHAAMVANIRRNDTIVTNGGIVGKVAKVTDDPEILVELAEGVKVKVVRDMIAQVRVKGEPVDEGGKK